MSDWLRHWREARKEVQHVVARGKAVGTGWFGPLQSTVPLSGPVGTALRWQLGLLVTLLLLGVVAMSSASVEYAAATHGDAFYHVKRYGGHLLLGGVAMVAMLMLPLEFWRRTDWMWLLVGFGLLLLVLIPGIGREVNGSRRWLTLGPLTLQASEAMKLCLLVYLAGYLERRAVEVQQHWRGFIKPMLVVFMVLLLLLMEPDFGATVVTVATAMGLIFLAGVKLGQFLLVMLSGVLVLAAVVVVEPYRIKRLVAFTDPWADQFNTGYQLTQALIAFGRGEWLGVGLGNSVQKLFYLPEAHTDFVFAIWAEEFGLLGALTVLVAFAGLIAAILRIGRSAEAAGQSFGAYLCYGTGLMLSGQVFINIGVNAGLLPTKGLTLPFFSYGGSSIIVSLALMGLVWRVAMELPRGRGGVA